MKYILKFLPRKLLIKYSFYLTPLLRVLFKGNKFIDPIDGSSYSKFLSYGYRSIRKNALCPGTLSLERHRLLWLYLDNETNILKSNLKVLHVAPEQIFFKKFKKFNHWNYLTFDINSPIADIKGDLKSMKFKDESFDLVICNHVLEHIEDDKMALEEIYRVLNINGIAILQVPINVNREKTFEDSKITSQYDREKYFGQYDHVREYGIDYKERIEQVGFQVEMINYSDNFSEEMIIRYGLLKNDLIPIAKKII
ncbi:MAG: class I SAM-dependent methyltransferase [Cryomorphaceae bacterium]|jgi:SAM-dependent methyltransferase|nr:class I SAM-dependent methyltransferase [Cryomorphaceae bacterium]MDG1889157.1 class I SAM-dependent methyltransferase [Flavobacteriaceae bacterium]MBT3503269.1 class I SAM-dependent methyltransferase [Cryomorphaceae bacterium]MBT3689101.1 class I SAM-dependent methyltransferase [Cryomorphaceae bacterium]MBT4222643.1 class I SAM-dependent methyltransferase [Cryomorphaceae bacterium]|tara:strand:+ start:364 stop:1122 length:759 start_codon:yes stop_codon:yes gene_type:complete